MPARALEVPHQRDDRRQHREDDQHLRDAFDLRRDAETDLQLERDDFQVVHQRAAFALAIPFEELLVLDQRSEEHTSELQSQSNLVCRLLLEKKKTQKKE